MFKECLLQNLNIIEWDLKSIMKIKKFIFVLTYSQFIGQLSTCGLPVIIK